MIKQYIFKILLLTGLMLTTLSFPLEASKTPTYPFEQAFGTEKVYLEFPGVPSTATFSYEFKAILQKNEFAYRFSTLLPYHSDVNTQSELLIDLYLSYIERNNCTITKQSRSMVDNNCIIYVSFANKSRLAEFKCIITPENIYILGVESPIGKSCPEKRHFMNSFSIAL